MAHYKRKHFWIDAPLQLRMLGYVLALVAASLLLVSFSITRALSMASLREHTIVHSLDWVRETMRGPLILSSCLAILASGLLTLVWSHRFAGPLRVLSAAMARLKQGNLSLSPRIRSTDTHQELVREFAQMQEGLRSLLQEDRDRLARALEKLKAAGAQAAGEEERARLREVADELELIGTRYQL
ncbi:MAG: methyl-accepting chemotaxis protein [Elusimicrobia bacterium]|nr:methyl-accepting chemotaxis protein [Elusimicrobiota bacterium]MDE2237024.1 methyl-accepting chemotaxis protein [Elusimicrobiota bacterium]MDE2425811.1 methyl-accepting chemotaxis protein [Elusimicrobiota bacterium]